MRKTMIAIIALMGALAAFGGAVNTASDRQ